MDDDPARPAPEARSPRERKGFDTSFSERLEMAELRRTLEVDRETGGAGDLSRAAAGEAWPGGEGDGPAELPLAKASRSEPAFCRPPPHENGELPPKPR